MDGAALLLSPFRVLTYEVGPLQMVAAVQREVLGSMAEIDREGAETRLEWTTTLPMALTLLAIFLSPLAYDLLRWMQEVFTAQ